MKNHFLILIALLFTVGSVDVFAQKDKKKLKKAGVIQLNDSITTYSQSGIFDFPNVNRIAFYQDASKLKRIELLDNAGQEESLYAILKNYVKNFGVVNFTQNVPLIWKLAKLSEKYGPPGEAILLYRLVLKHHRQGINIEDLLQRYQFIEVERKEYYVPLDYYYKLVDYRKEIDTLQPPHSVLVNMGDDINSQKEDYGPAIGNVDDVLLFTSKRNQHSDLQTRTYDEDLFFSKKVDGFWTPAEAFKGINSSFNEGSATLSLDGKSIFFSRCNTPESMGNCDLFEATLKPDSTWGNIKNLGPTINSTGWDSHPSLTHKGDTLFFASNRLGGFGLSDIYYSTKDDKGVWQKAKNAGPIINTKDSEVSPFFHHTSNVLYFSSNGHPLNFGLFDIYKTKHVANTWSEPKNTGPLVNGAGSEYYFTIDSKSQSLYYARSVEETPDNLDLYSFPVPMEAQPEAVTNLKGTLKDEVGKPMKGIVSVIDLDENVEVAPKFIRDDGSFDFSLINKRNYLLIIQGDEFFRIEELFFMDGDREINKIAEPIESKIAFTSLEFENGKANILEAMHADLDKLANFLIDHPQLKLKISGHTDSDGKEEDNLRLSQARADAIKKYLVTGFKIEEDRITSSGYGSSKPAAQEVTDDHKQLNRRVEFEISK